MRRFRDALSSTLGHSWHPVGPGGAGGGQHWRIPSESDHHLFILRIWTDTAKSTPSIRRGSIEHVPSGERRYFLELGEVQTFVASHLSELTEYDGRGGRTLRWIP